nr:PorV/PorQ family protein [candidate division Zixibacteria bacterium]
MKSRHLTVVLGLAAMLLLCSGSLWADENNPDAGTSAFYFLKIPVGARPMAMGGAFTGVANDETSLYYNPGGIADLKGKRYVAGYNNNVFDMQSGFLGYIHPVGENRKVTVYLNYLSYGDFVETDDTGRVLGTFGGSDLLFAAGYAMNINPKLAVGGTLKLIYEKIDDFSATGFAIDLGARLAVDRQQRTHVGVMIQNLGKQLSTFGDGEKDPLPLVVRGGVSSYLKGLPLLIAGDLIYPTDNDLYFALGGELLALKPLYLRLGYSNFGENYKTGSSKDDLSGFTAGFGVDYKYMQISYTITPQAELGTSHRITLTGGFQ